MIHKFLNTYKTTTYFIALILPIVSSCSVISGGSASNDPAVIAQQRQVDAIENEVRIQKQRTDEAKSLYKREDNLLDAKESELKAAKQLLKVYKNQAKQ